MQEVEVKWTKRKSDVHRRNRDEASLQLFHRESCHLRLQKEKGWKRKKRRTRKKKKKKKKFLVYYQWECVLDEV